MPETYAVPVDPELRVELVRVTDRLALEALELPWGWLLTWWLDGEPLTEVDPWWGGSQVAN